MASINQRAYRLILGKVIQSLRSKRGFSQTEFAELIGVSQPTISRIEKGSVPACWLAKLE